MVKSKIQEKMKELEKIEGLYLLPAGDFLDGNFSRNKKNRIKMSLSFDAKQLCKDKCEGIPLKYSDFKLVPFILFVDWDLMKKQQEKTK